MMPKSLSLGSSTFSKLIKGNRIYVDKTEYIYRLIHHSRDAYYFFSRPRRFGKSLLISTMKELFSGNRELFKGLWIDQSDYDWQNHPVIHLDFADLDYQTAEQFRESLILKLIEIGRDHEIHIERSTLLNHILSQLVKGLSQKNSVVFLVDEYDKPILDHLNNFKEADKIRTILNSFFSAAKSLESYWRCVFITGVSKFAKTSVFSGFNNLNDLSEDRVASSLLGYTQNELEHYFARYMASLACKQSKSDDEIRELLKFWYNGYRFCADLSLERVYNPFSINYVFGKEVFSNYWFDSGTPSFLIGLLRKQKEPIGKLDGSLMSDSGFRPFDLENLPLLPVFYQTGYLTIQDVYPEEKMVKLGYPNAEVRESMNPYLLGIFLHQDRIKSQSVVYEMKQALLAGDVERFVEFLQSLLANIPAKLHIPQERYYHSLLQLVCNLMGLEANSEIHTSQGIIDLVLEFPKQIYIMELKFNRSAKEALKQIQNKHYQDKYRVKGKPMLCVGLSFKRQQGGLVIDWFL